MEPWVEDALAGARVGRLATVGREGTVGLVPICFAVVGGRLVSAVDHKPKRTSRLRRLDDIVASGRATVLVDHYDEDWTRLWWVRVTGRADVLDDGDPASSAARDALVGKYGRAEQYGDNPPAGPVYRVALDEVTAWRWTS
jgi:PPOX class probable F420-dependent enzyme